MTFASFLEFKAYVSFGRTISHGWQYCRYRFVWGDRVSSPLVLKKGSRTHFVDHVHDSFQRRSGIQSFHVFRYFACYVLEQANLCLVVVLCHRYRSLCTHHNGPANVPCFAADYPACEITDCILKSFVVSFDDVFVAVIGVILNAAVKGEVVAHCIYTKSIKSEEWIHDIAG